MITQCDFTTWSELEVHIRDLVETSASSPEEGSGSHSPLLFRGQADSCWELETTLERARPRFAELSAYYRVAAVAKTQIETFTNHRWDDIDYPRVVELLSSYDQVHFTDFPAYDFLIYLRHHGFPSPLLDWTRSLYIAAFFAFRAPKGERVGIFAYQEFAGRGKLSSSTSPQIKTLGPYVRSHPRHFLQQGEYTLCWKYSEGTWRSAPHASVFSETHEVQDRLWKFTLPASESSSVLKHLGRYNINAFSLFQSEESLMETLAREMIPPEGP